jgi:hypothetical protein
MEFHPRNRLGIRRTARDPPHRAILEKIGRELRECLELPRELPHRLLTALIQLNANAEQAAGPETERDTSEGSASSMLS